MIRMVMTGFAVAALLVGCGGDDDDDGSESDEDPVVVLVRIIETDEGGVGEALCAAYEEDPSAIGELAEDLWADDEILSQLSTDEVTEALSQAC